MKSPYDILRTRVVTERSTEREENESSPKYTFTVAKGANKTEIRRAVEQVFNVKVTAVNTINVRGKMRRVRYHRGQSASSKKAVVTLAAGERIDLA